MKISTLGILAAAVASGLFAQSAQAFSIEITGSSVSGPVAGIYDYSYTMTLTAGDSLSAVGTAGGAYTSLFTFFDLAGLTGATFTAGATPVAAWSIITEATTAVGPAPGGWAGGLSTLTSEGGFAVEPDSAAAPNVRYQYVGAPLSVAVATVLGTAHLFSTIGPGGFIQYDARWIDTASGRSQVNTDTPIGPSTIPVPAAAWAGLSTLSGLGLLGLLRKRRN